MADKLIRGFMGFLRDCGRRSTKCLKYRNQHDHCHPSPMNTTLHSAELEHLRARPGSAGSGGLSRNLAAQKALAQADPNQDHFTMDETKENNVKSGQQGTKEPWKKPEKSDHQPTKDGPSPRPRRPEDNETS